MKKKNILNKRKSPFSPKGPNAIWLLFFFLAIGFAYLFWYNSINRQIEQVKYSELLKLIDENKIESVVVQDQLVQGKLKNGKRFESYVIPSHG